MGVFNRVKDIITANINALLDKAEDPSKMLRLMIQEMEDTIIDLKSSCAAQLAEKKTINRELMEADNKIVQWRDRATLALEKGRDDLAKEALVEKRNWREKGSGFRNQFEVISTNVDLLRDDILKLEKKLISVKAKYKEFVVRSKQAEATQRVNASAYSKLNEMERQFERMEDEFTEFESSGSIDSELEDLKNQIKRESKWNG